MICFEGRLPGFLAAALMGLLDIEPRGQWKNRILGKDADVGSGVGCFKMGETEYLNISGMHLGEKEDREKGTNI